MRLNPANRTRLLADVVSDIDPTGSTVEIKVDGTWYPATWLGSPVVSGAQWTQTARTVSYFAGPEVTVPAGAVVLTTGRHVTKARITQGSDVLVAVDVVVVG